MSKKEKILPLKNLDSYHYHEGCDRVYFINDIIERHIKSHPVFKKHKKIRKKITKIIDDLSELYQLIGYLEHLKIEEEKK